MFKLLAGTWIASRVLRLLRRLLAAGALAGTVALIATNHVPTAVRQLEHSAQNTLTHLLERALSSHPGSASTPPASTPAPRAKQAHGG